MSKELLALMDRVDLQRFAKSPPKKMLYRILKDIERQRHYGHSRNWELAVEFLAKWLVLNEDISLSKIGTIKSFEGLSLEEDKLYRQLSPLLKHYVVAAKNNPWDHLGEVYTELGLVGPGQNMTPKTIVDFMIKATYPEKVTKISTQLDPCVGSGRFLFEASILMPEAPLVLFGIEINLSLYRACLVNMAMFSNHPYSIICADTLRLDPDKSGPSSKLWDLGNRWNPPDVSAFYWKPPPIGPDQFSLKAFTKQTK